MRLRLSKEGLTLVELLVVIGIIAVLVGILWVVFAPIRQRARLTHCINNFRQLYLALENYRHDWDGADIETAQTFDDLALPLSPYIVTGNWPFLKVSWVWGNQDLWHCPATIPAARMIRHGGVYLDYWYRPEPRAALAIPGLTEDMRQSVLRAIARLEQEFRRRRGEFVLIYHQAHTPIEITQNGRIGDMLVLRLNGQVQIKRRVDTAKPQEW
jgi:prepilin-type N-terminal cleavage/methylation domain-containing protein